MFLLEKRKLCTKMYVFYRFFFRELHLENSGERSLQKELRSCFMILAFATNIIVLTAATAHYFVANISAAPSRST